MEYAPEHACVALARVQRDLRWAWNGPRKSFSIVQLINKRHCGTPANPQFAFDEYWGYEDRVNEHGEMFTVPVDHGVIFSTKGTLKPDWDREHYFPIHSLNLSMVGWPPECVYDTGFIPRLKEMLRPGSVKDKELNERKYSQYKSFVEQAAEENVDRLRFRARNAGDSAKITTREERVGAVAKAMREAEENEKKVKRRYGVE
jgi:hypothetical protein